LVGQVAKEPGRGLAVILLITGGLAAVALAWCAVTPSSVKPVTVELRQFSAARAARDIGWLAQAPHPLGSDRNRQVGRLLVARLQALGFEVFEREPQLGVFQTPQAPELLVAGRVRNIIGILPGQDRNAPAVLLMSHYDSVANSAGAADDGGGVAAALEIAANAKAAGGHRRDLILLFTDGEEAGLLGADAFFSRDPLRTHVGAVFNMEARGDSGRAMLIETARKDNAWLTALSPIGRPAAVNPLVTFLYESAPSRTDFSHALDAGLTGLNFSFMGSEFAYHSPISTPNHVDLRSVQDLGDAVGPAARRALDAAAWPRPSGAIAASDLLGVALVRYPAGWGWGLIAAAAALLFMALRGGLLGRAGAMSLLQGASGVAQLFAVEVAVLRAAERWLTPAGDYVQRRVALGYMPQILIGLLLLSAGIALTRWSALAAGAQRRWTLAAFGLIGGLGLVGGADATILIAAGAAILLLLVTPARAAAPEGLWWGGTALGLACAAAAQVLAPACAPVLAWPTLVASIALLWLAGTNSTRLWRRGAAGALAVLALAQILIWAEGLVVMVGPASLSLAAPLAAIGALLVLPLLAQGGPHLRISIVCGMVLAAAGAAALALPRMLGPGPGDPTVTEAFALDDLATGRRGLASSLPRRDDWTRAVLGPQARRIDARPEYPKPIWFAAAPQAPPSRLTQPALALQRDGAGAIALTAQAANGGRILRFFLRPSYRVSAVSIDGRRIAMAMTPRDWSEIDVEADAPAVHVGFAGPEHGQVDLRLLEQIDGWPAGVATPGRPAKLARTAASDTTQVITAKTLSW